MKPVTGMLFEEARREFEQLLAGCAEKDVLPIRDVHDAVVAELDRRGLGLTREEERARELYKQITSSALVQFAGFVKAGTIDRGATDAWLEWSAPWRAAEAAVEAEELAAAILPMSEPTGDDRRAA